jgi:hypothetical protein
LVCLMVSATEGTWEGWGRRLDRGVMANTLAINS